MTTQRLSVAAMVVLLACYDIACAAQPAAAGLGRTQKQILDGLEEYFPPPGKESFAGGELRRSWSNERTHTVLIVSGDTDDVQQVFVFMPVAPELPAAVMCEAFAIGFTLLKNTLPDWDRRADWFVTAMREVSRRDDLSSVRIQVGMATVLLQVGSQRVPLYSLGIRRTDPKDLAQSKKEGKAEREKTNESEQNNRCRVFHENGWDHRM